MAMAAIAFHGVFTTLTMIMVHTPYRHATLEMLHLKSKRSMKTSNNSNIMLQAVNGLHMT